MAYTTIPKSTDYFNTKLYTGTGSSNAQTGVGFQPDWIWLKNRSSLSNHHLVDAVRGITKELRSNLTNTEATDDQLITAFGSDGFTVGTSGSGNTNGDNYASWNWKANGAGSANTDGDINSTVSANTTSGFSIVKYTGNGTAGATVGHGLGVKPAMIIFKCLSVAGPSWVVYHQSKGATYTLYLNETSGGGTSAEMLNNTEPTSSLITLGNGTSSNSSSASTIAYCFAEKQGYSKFGSYTGNGSADGPFIYTGMKPAFIMIKRTDAASQWTIYDNKRLGYNVGNNYMFVTNDAEGTGINIDLLSNGFKARQATSNEINTSGASYIYMAFAEAPLVGTNNIPANAR